MAFHLADEAIPVVLSAAYSTYRERLDQGGFEELLGGVSCPAPGCSGTLQLTGRRVDRGAVTVESGRLVCDTIEIAVACCVGGAKRHWCRVLPSEIQPRKAYSLPAQEAAIASYWQGNGGLRKAISRLAGEAPHFTTLHGWLGGVGRYALGRDTPPDAQPMAVVCAESQRRCLPSFETVWNGPIFIDPRRYRSEQRHEELKASKRLTQTAHAVAGETPFPLAEWARLVLTWGVVTTMAWWSRIRETAIQHHAARRTALPSARDPPRAEDGP